MFRVLALSERLPPLASLHEPVALPDDCRRLDRRRLLDGLTVALEVLGLVLERGVHRVDRRHHLADAGGGGDDVVLRCFRLGR